MELTYEQVAFQDECKSFVDRDEIIPVASQFDSSNAIPREFIQKLAQVGYLGAIIPPEYGDRSLDMLTLGILHEEIGRGCSSIRSLLTVHGMAALGLLKWGDDAQRERWLKRLTTGESIGAFALTEPNVGSDAKSIETTAVLVGDEYILNGRKNWTANPPLLSWRKIVRVFR